MLAWRIYYADGSTFDSSMGGPADAPALGGVCILQRDADGRNVELLREKDYYSHDGVRWVPHDESGVWVRLFSRLRMDGLIVGIMLRPEQYQHIIRRAKADADFYGYFTKEQIEAFLRDRTS